MTFTPIDRPAAVHDSQLNTSGGGRTQDARAGRAPLPTPARPANATTGVTPELRSAAGKPRPGGPPPGRGTLTPAATTELARFVAAAGTPGTGEADPGIHMHASPGRGIKTPAGGGRRRAAGALPAGTTTRIDGLPRRWVLELPAGMEMLSLNGREHWSARNRKAQAFKQAAWALAKRAKIPPLGRVSIAAEYQPGDLRRRDPDNPVPSAKACIDGLVAAQVIPDDSARYVAAVTSSIGSLYPKGRLVLTITEVAP